MRDANRCGLRELAAAALLALSLAGCGSTVEHKPAGGTALFDSMAVPGASVDPVLAASVISEYRRANGLGPVSIDPALMQLAASQANIMARTDKLSHTTGGPLGKRARASGYEYARIAENVGAGHDTLADAFAGWRDSPGHRANMLMQGVSRIGIAVQQAPRSRYKVYWAMIVAEPPPPGAVRADQVAAGNYAGRWNTFGSGPTVVTGSVPGGVQVQP